MTLRCTACGAPFEVDPPGPTGEERCYCGGDLSESGLTAVREVVDQLGGVILLTVQASGKLPGIHTPWEGRTAVALRLDLGLGWSAKAGPMAMLENEDPEKGLAELWDTGVPLLADLAVEMFPFMDAKKYRG